MDKERILLTEKRKSGYGVLKKPYLALGRKNEALEEEELAAVLRRRNGRTYGNFYSEGFGETIYSKKKNEWEGNEKCGFLIYMYSPPSETTVFGNCSAIMAPRDVTCAGFEKI